jgi:hypothetical protein
MILFPLVKLNDRFRGYLINNVGIIYKDVGEGETIVHPITDNTTYLNGMLIDVANTFHSAKQHSDWKTLMGEATVDDDQYGQWMIGITGMNGKITLHSTQIYTYYPDVQTTINDLATQTLFPIILLEIKATIERSKEVIWK